MGHTISAKRLDLVVINEENAAVSRFHYSETSHRLKKMSDKYLELAKNLISYGISQSYQWLSNRWEWPRRDQEKGQKNWK